MSDPKKDAKDAKDAPAMATPSPTDIVGAAAAEPTPLRSLPETLASELPGAPVVDNQPLVGNQAEIANARRPATESTANRDYETVRTHVDKSLAPGVAPAAPVAPGKTKK